VKNKRRRTIVILLIIFVVIGFFLRTYNISYGLPSVSHEEYVTLGRAWVGFHVNSYNPQWFNWPSLLFYIELFLLKLLCLFGYCDWTPFVQAVRGLQAIIGTLTIPLVYLIGSKLFTRRAGIIASFLAVFFHVHVLYSHIARPEVLVSFFFLLVILLSIRLLQTGKIRYYVLSLIVVGFAISVKYNGVFSLGVPLIAYILSPQIPRRTVSKILHYTILIIVPLLVFVFTNPYSVIEHGRFFEGIQYQADRISYSLSTQFVKTGAVFIDSTGWVGFVLSLFGVGMLIRKHNKYDIFFIACFISSLLLVFIWNPSSRLLLTSMFLLLMLVAGLIDKVFTRLFRMISAKWTLSISLIIIGIVAAYPVWRCLLLLRELSRTSVSDTVMLWVQDNIPAGSSIYWGYEATAPFFTNKGIPRYRLTGDMDPDQQFSSFAAFANENYDFVILTEQHRSYTLPEQPDEYRFYAQLFNSAIVHAFPWDRTDDKASSSPYSQVFRSNDQLRGTIYIYKIIKQ